MQENMYLMESHRKALDSAVLTLLRLCGHICPRSLEAQNFAPFCRTGLCEHSICPELVKLQEYHQKSHQNWPRFAYGVEK